MDQAMQDHIIDRAEVFLVGPNTERYTWAEGMTAGRGFMGLTSTRWAGSAARFSVQGRPETDQRRGEHRDGATLG